MREIRVEGWIDLQDKLYEDSWSPGLQRFRSPFLFRGLSDAAYNLETTLMRLRGPFPKLEHHLLRNFQKYAHRSVVERDSLWNWLSVAQHHGLPTRLLDWTYSPLVAMHFATSETDKSSVDGVIWKVNYVHKHLPEPFQAEIGRVSAYAFDVHMLSNVVQSLEELDHFSPSEFAVFFEPPSMDDRIVNQFGLFSIMSSPSARLDLWLKERVDKYPWIAERIIIPGGKIKWEIRDKLDQANITERVLFPGLDGLSKWLARNYRANS